MSARGAIATDVLIGLVCAGLLSVGVVWLWNSYQEGQQAKRDVVALRAQAEETARNAAAANTESRSLAGIFDNVTTDLQVNRNANANAAATTRSEIRRAPAARTLADRRVSPDFVRLFNRARGATPGAGGGPADDPRGAAAAGGPDDPRARAVEPGR